MAVEKGWAIAGDFGLYTGWWMTRNAAIGEHVSQKVGIGCFNHAGRGLTKEQAKAWEACKSKGDRAVKVKITYARR